MAADIFAKLGDIKGESQDAKHKDEIEVLSFSWGLTHPQGTGSGVAAGKATFQDLVIVHRIDKATPHLLKACATGTHIKDATIVHRKIGKTPLEYMIVKLDDVLITGVTESGTGPDNAETVSLTFAKIDLEYRSQKPDGTADTGIHFKYDLKTNKVW